MFTLDPGDELSLVVDTARKLAAGDAGARRTPNFEGR